MNELYECATGYFELEFDIPRRGLLAGDQIFIGTHPQDHPRLAVVAWDDRARLCERANGRFWDCFDFSEAPAEATVIGDALFVSRTLPTRKEVTA